MKAYIVTKEPFPNGMAATNRIKCYARAIHDGGMDCEVLICGSTELVREKVKNPEAKGYYEGVPYKYIGGSSTDFHIKPLRLWGQFLRLLKTEKYLLQNLKKGDILFLYMGVKINWLLRFMKIAKKNKAFCVRDLCELPYGTGAETRKHIRLRNKTFEKQFSKLDGIVSISDALLQLAQQHTLPACKHIKIPIMVEYEHFKMQNKSMDANVPYIFHSGTLYQQKDGILGMIEAFGIAKQQLLSPLKYILTGRIDEASHPEELKSIIQKYSLEDSIEFVGYLTRDQVKEYLSKASLVISNRPKSKQDYYGFSTKLGEYLASGTPLITTYWGEAINWLKNGENAYIIEPENTKALADTIVHVFNNFDEAKRIGLKGQELCHTYFDYRVWSKPLVNFLTSIAEQNYNENLHK